MKNKKMEIISVNDFVNGYLACQDGMERVKYIETKLEITPYVPYMTKVVLAQELVNKSMYDNTGNIHISSEIYYVFTYKCLLEMYTNLRSKAENFTLDYDKLNKSGLLDILFFGYHTTEDNKENPSLIPSKEIAEFKMIADMLQSDAMKNNYEPHAFITKQINKIKVFIEEFSETYSDKIPEIINNLNDDQVNKITNMVDKARKIISIKK